MATRKFNVRSYPGFLGITVLCLTILYVPLMVVAVYSFNASESIVVWEGFSMRWYADVFTCCDSNRNTCRHRDDTRRAVQAAHLVFRSDLTAPYGARNRYSGCNADLLQLDRV